MTREEEIKARLSKDTAVYLDDLTGDWDNRADDDLEYILTRNEELQRRIDHLESEIQSALEYWNRSETDGAMVDALFTIEERLEKALDAADAEEK